MHKRVIGPRLIVVSHSRVNIAKHVVGVAEEYGLIDKVFFVTLDNSSLNTCATLDNSFSNACATLV
jgi:hypothetical protein